MEEGYFPVVSWILSIIITVVIAYLFRYRWFTEQEKIYRKNMRHAISLIFDRIYYADVHKECILTYLDEQEKCCTDTNRSVVLPPNYYNEVFRLRDLILEEVRSLSRMQIFFSYIILDQYQAVQRYMLSAARAITRIGNEENRIINDMKTWERHRYYAREIIKLFGNDTPRWFKEKWEKEFSKVGGIDLIMPPDLEPGDQVGIYDLNREFDNLLFYNPDLSEIKGELKEIKKMIESLKE